MPTVCSAAETTLPYGAFTTTTPWREQASTSMLSTPTPARTMARSGLTEEQVSAILRSQASREQRLAAADDVIDNNGDLEHLRAQVHQLHGRYLQLASARR